MANKRSASRSFLISAWAILLLPACQPTALPPVVPAAGTQPATVETTPIVATTSEFQPEPLAAVTAAAGEVLRFTFPTPGSQPVSQWRPPLYAVPWALAPYDHFLFVRPIAADQVNWPLADYRYGGVFSGTDIIHTGIDIPSPRGTTVSAAGPGKVMSAGYGLFYGNNDPDDPYGLAVSIKHDFGYTGNQLYTVYAHLDRIDVIPGQRVETGSPLGIVGTTGNTTGPHLHFEVRIESNSFFATRNPELWLAPPQGWGVLVGRLLNTNGSLLSRQEVTVESLETKQKWSVISYGDQTVISDDYYRENLILSDLPAGNYKIVIDYLEERFISYTTIHPGAVTYMSFRGKEGFGAATPPAPSAEDFLTEPTS